MPHAAAGRWVAGLEPGLAKGAAQTPQSPPLVAASDRVAASYFSTA